MRTNPAAAAFRSRSWKQKVPREESSCAFKPHWDKLVLRSWSDGEPYQEGPVTAMRSPEDLMGRYPL